MGQDGHNQAVYSLVLCRASGLGCGLVSSSKNVSIANASWAELPHISKEGFKRLQTAGLSGLPNRRQRLSGVNWIHRTPAGLPWGMPGMGDEMDGAIQHAPQPAVHFNGSTPIR